MNEASNASGRDGLVALVDLAKELEVDRRTLDRACEETGIERRKFIGDRKTYVDGAALRAEMSRPRRRPQRRHRAGGQGRDGRGRFAPATVDGNPSGA